MRNGERIALVRAWALTVFGCVAIAVGLWRSDAAAIMVGFSTLGMEPQLRAATGKVLNGA